MITRIEVDGFKSLDEFSLDLQQGLNVLVGPNGGGKTNIILFFEFLSNIVRNDVSEAISRLGGAGSVFRRIGQTEFQNTIKATVYGCQPMDSKNFCHYRYTFDIHFPIELESVVYRHQFLGIRFTKHFVEARDNLSNDLVWDITIDQSFESIESPKVKIEAKDPKLLRTPYGEKHIKRDSTFTRRAEKFIARLSSPQESIFHALSRFYPGIPPIVGDMISGETYNIIPSRVKVPEDSAKSAGIAKDGSGLSATLYAIKRKKRFGDRFIPHFYYYYRRRQLLPSLSIQDLLKYLTLANNSIADIDVVNDPFNNQLKVTLRIANGDYQATLPLSSMSDGTIKWIAMITAVMTATSMFAIEEPENYLHPSMQSQVLNIMRDVLISRREYSFSVMTTHSETILNSCNPRELVVVSFSEGSTHARRCSNTDELNSEIKRTGFGLGYYYLAGAIEDE